MDNQSAQVIGFLLLFVLPLFWKPSRKAIGLMNIIIGAIISLTGVGIIVGKVPLLVEIEQCLTPL